MLPSTSEKGDVINVKTPFIVHDELGSSRQDHVCRSSPHQLKWAQAISARLQTEELAYQQVRSPRTIVTGYFRQIGFFLRGASCAGPVHAVLMCNFGSETVSLSVSQHHNGVSKFCLVLQMVHVIPLHARGSWAGFFQTCICACESRTKQKPRTTEPKLWM